MPRVKYSEELTVEEAKRELVRCRVIRDRLAYGDLTRLAYPRGLMADREVPAGVKFVVQRLATALRVSGAEAVAAGRDLSTRVFNAEVSRLAGLEPIERCYRVLERLIEGGGRYFTPNGEDLTAGAWSQIISARRSNRKRRDLAIGAREIPVSTVLGKRPMQPLAELPPETKPIELARLLERIDRLYPGRRVWLAIEP